MSDESKQDPAIESMEPVILVQADPPPPPKPVANANDYRRRLVLLQHNHGRPIQTRPPAPRLTRKQIRQQRHAAITARRKAQESTAEQKNEEFAGLLPVPPKPIFE
jgi:hypothetical protein